ncbi:MAG: HAMP domain-containing histidine kinase [Aquificae bacterium]|nr:HAMP domain-containing histidine kinase [Aquificota bacterium]
MFSIKKLLPRNRYERESFLKAFLLFFAVLELSLLAVFALLYKSELEHRRYALFLELKNYGLSLEGDEFPVDVVYRRSEPFYELLEDEQSYYILVPIPGVEKEAIKIYYPKEAFKKDAFGVLKKLLTKFLLASLAALVISALFARYALKPLRRALDLIEEVTRDIIHDMNTPLTTLKINLAMAKGKLTPAQYERLSFALKQLESLRDNLSPLDREVQLKLEELELSSLVKKELEELKKLYPGVPVESSLKPVRVTADLHAVTRIVSNALSNAFKHYGGKGPVKVVLTDEALVVENPSKPVKHPERLFERFYRESQRGMGLGLSIVKKLSEALGWEVRASYEKGRFRLTVRFSREAGGQA